MNKKTIIVFIVIVLLVGVGVYYFINSSSSVDIKLSQNKSTTTNPFISTSTKPVNKIETVIGKSVNGKDITAFHYGTGSDEVLFIGGIHGGYEWNTVSLAYEIMDYLKANPNVIPKNLKVTVIPVMNPDGLNKVVGTPGRFDVSKVPESEIATIPGRFNANTVDLNRNFDCDWQVNGTWQNKTVSGGSKVFSEPESQAIKSYVESNNPKAVVVWYSAAGGVYSSNCHAGVLAETRSLTNAYARASGYKPYEEFDNYEITGDMVNWLAKKNIPAISVLLTNHVDTELSKNQAGVGAILKYYTE